MSKKYKSFLISILFILTIIIAKTITIDSSANDALVMYHSGGYVEDYIEGKGSYFTGNPHAVYIDNYGRVAYCIQSDISGPPRAGAGGYTQGSATVEASDQVKGAVTEIMYRGYPARYGTFICGGTEAEPVYKSGMIFNGRFFECTAEEARSATAFALHRQMNAVAAQYPDGVAGNASTIISFENADNAQHDVVEMVYAMNDYSVSSNMSINIGYAEYDNGYRETGTAVFNDEAEGRKSVIFKISCVNCSVSDISLITSEGYSPNAYIEDIIYEDVFTRYVKVVIPASDLANAKKVGISTSRETVSRDDVIIYGHPSYQDLVSYSGFDSEVSAEISADLPYGGLRIVKRDAATQNTLQGVRFGIYTDAGCTKLFREVTTDPEGKAEFECPSGAYYIKELSPRAGYVTDDTVYRADVSAGSVAEKLIYNRHVTAELFIVKKDSDTGEAAAQGDASLKGAVYTLYAADDIYHPDGKTGILYSKDDEVQKLITDEKGAGYTTGLMPGRYYLKETAAPEGYKLSDTVYNVNITASGSEEVVKTDVSVYDEVKKQAFQLIKISDTVSGEVVTLQNAGFTAWLISDLTLDNETGRYITEGVEPVILSADGNAELFTDSNGYAASAMLPYGSYLVRETTVPKGYLPIEDFTVVISEDSTEPQSWRIFKDEEFRVSLRVYKVDRETGETVTEEGFGFRIYDVSQDTYVSVENEDIFYTDADGVMSLPLPLNEGEYILEEAVVPEDSDYLLNDEKYTFTIASDNMYEEDEKGLPVLNIRYGNELITGVIEVEKQGEEGPLQDVIFELFAAEDINRGRVKAFSQDEKIATLITDENGYCNISDLPLGDYYLKEVKTAEGYVLPDDIIPISLTKDKLQGSVVYEEKVLENRKTTVEIFKLDSENECFVEGAQMELYDKDGELLYEWTTESGIGYIIRGLKPGETYVICEKEAPYGYEKAEDMEITIKNTEEAQNIVMYDDISKGRLQILKTGEMLNVCEPYTENEVIMGYDFYYSCEALAGAHFTVYAAEDNVIYEAGEAVGTITSDISGTAHMDGLPLGKYYIVEEDAPCGYISTDEKIYFEIDGEDRETNVEIENDRFRTTVSVFKCDKLSQEGLGGAVIGLYNKNDILNHKGEMIIPAHSLIDTTVTDSEGFGVFDADLPQGEYYMVEMTAPSGYELSDDVYDFVIDSDEEEITLTIENIHIEEEVSTEVKGVYRENDNTPVKTGDNSEPVLIVIAAVASIVVLVAIIRKMRYYHKR